MGYLKVLPRVLDQYDRPLEIDNSYFDQFKGLSFKEFWEALPKKIPYYDYEKELTDFTEAERYVRLKKATGMGGSEFYLRFFAWKCLNETWNKEQVDVTGVLITGPRIGLAIQLIDRLKGLFDYEFKTRSTVAELNGCKIEAFPSHHTEAARGLNPKFVILDEADFFPVSEQMEARSVAERYIPKSNPYLIMISTPYNPGGLYDIMDQEKDSLWKLKEWHYQTGLDAGIYTHKQIEIAKKSPSFPREYELQYGVGVGNLYPSGLIDELIESYDLTYKDGEKVRCIDPAYGSSKFAISEWERIDGIMYCKYCIQLDRPSPTAITQHIVERNNFIRMNTLVDSAHPGLIRDLVDRNVEAREVKFNQTLSNMTIEGTQTVKEKRVRLHPDICRPLIQQLKAVESNDKGHPDKTKLNFDLGDTYQMAADHLKISNVSLTVVNPYIDDDE